MPKITKEDLELINKYTRRELSAEEVYTFPLVLCTDQIDRDHERFDSAALDEMARLYVGKTVIRDHRPTADNQTARIYRAQVEDREGGGRQLVAYAYLPVTESTRDIIEQLDAGIKKEVSVGCSVSRAVCSVCGKQRGSCGHIGGREYSGSSCYFTLSGITDVYEVSFVAVPAQPEAGVIKSCDITKTYIEDNKKTKEDQELEDRLLEADIRNKERMTEYEHYMQQENV